MSLWQATSARQKPHAWHTDHSDDQNYSPIFRLTSDCVIPPPIHRYLKINHSECKALGPDHHEPHCLIPESEGCHAILTLMDQFTKMVHLTPFAQLPTSADTAHLLISHVFHLHDVPDQITSDLGTQFASWIWRAVFHFLEVHFHISTTCHPETDGQLERVNQVLEEYLQYFTNFNQDDWTSLTLHAEFIYNNVDQALVQLRLRKS